TVNLHREELLTLLKQVSLFTSDVTPSVKLTLNEGELALQAMNSKVGEGNVQMPVDYHENKLEIAFHPHFFIDILRHSKDETVTFGIIDSFHPGSITDTSDSQFILMPMRLATE
ncbi:MAG: DNA polymerase III subunit beta, partial [Verrucomicrobia bacterium]|nr:DNA polymerase III subunit beta [Verrucomicrobiota bacterium]